MDADQLCVVAMVVWSIWITTGLVGIINVIRGEKVCPPALGVARSLYYFSEFKDARLLMIHHDATVDRNHDNTMGKAAGIDCKGKL